MSVWGKIRTILVPFIFSFVLLIFLFSGMFQLQPLHAAPVDIVVNSLADEVADDGQCTLREAITSANFDGPSGSRSGECIAGNGTDIIDLTGLSGTITLHDSLTDILRDVTIQGPGAELLTIDARRNGRIFTILSGAVTIADVTIANGYEGVDDGSGGGIFVSSLDTVRIENTVIQDNQVVGDSGTTDCFSQQGLFSGKGGGIHHVGQGTLYVENSVISGNSSHGGNGGSGGYGLGGGGGGGALGGGLFNDGGVVYIINSSFVDNSVTGGRGGPRGSGGSSGCSGKYGGGESGALGGGGRGGDYNHIDGHDAQFGGGGGGGQNPYGNGGDSPFAGGHGGSGGGGRGGAGGGGAALGGGIFNYSGSIYITGSTFDNNSAVGGEGPDNAEFGQGIASAIFNWDTLVVESSLVPNTAPILEQFNPLPDATNVPIDQILTWDVSELDGDDYLYGYAGSGLTQTIAFGDDLLDLSLITTTGVVTSYIPLSLPLQAATTYYWSISATDGISITESGVMSFTTAPLPTVDFTAVTPEGASPFTASFTNNTADAHSYNWDFGDGGSSTAVHPNHQYINSGYYTVTLEAIGLGGTSTFTRSNYIFVYDLPEPNFTASPQVGLPNVSVEFTNTSQFADSYEWDYGDGTQSTIDAQTHNHTYTEPGSYTVVLTATNAYGERAITRADHVVVYAEPVAEFSASPLSGVEPLIVNFTNHSQNSSSYMWNFGDGNLTNVTSPSHLYQNSGMYTITLIASNLAGTDTITKTEYITVHPQAIANFSAAPNIGALPLNVEFTNLSSDGVSYIWDYGDGITSTVSAAIHSHLYTDPGIYDVTLTAIGTHSSDTIVRTSYVRVYEYPVASFSAIPTSGTDPLLVHFSNSSLHATNALWDFGDGSSSTALNPSHLYLQPGTYTVTLTASNPIGSDLLTRSEYVVVHKAPRAAFASDVQVGTVPLAVTFTNNSTDADSFVWNYGDGTTSTTTAISHTHVYTIPGSYTVSLAAFNPYGNHMQTRLSYIHAYAVPVPAFSANPEEGAAPLTVSFNNDSINATSYFWQFGDGSATTAVSPEHTYYDPGVYTVTLQARNAGGSQTIEYQNLITVHHPPTPAFTATPTEGLDNLTVSFVNLSQYADSYVWDYGDGSSSNTTAVTHTHQYDAPGTYTVRLTAANDHASNTVTENNLITVYEAPAADFESTIDFGASPLAVGFANLSTGATSYLWDFGDGNSSTSSTPTHIYTQGGLYTVTLTASNPFGTDTAVKTAYIHVYDEPIADFTALPRIGVGPLLVTFRQESQFADDYVWEYGDGITSTTTAIAHTHLFTEPGQYTVSLTANNAYETDATTRIAYITVIEPPTKTAYFVDAEGGSNDGDGSQTDPWQTITYALSQAIGPNVNVYAATGTYDQSIGEVFPIVMEPQVSLIGAGHDSTIIAGVETDSVIQFPGTSVYTATTVLSGFKIMDGAHGVLVNASSNNPAPIIEDNWITENTHGIYSTASTSQHAYPVIRNNLIDHNDIYGFNGNAGYYGTTISPVIDQNRIAFNGQAGIRCYAQGHGSSGGLSRCSPEISNNEIVHNGGDGILCQTYYAGRCNSIISNNFIAYNADWGFDRTHAGTYIQGSVDARTRPTFINNIIVKNGTGGARFITNTSERFDIPTFINDTVADNGSYGIWNGRPLIYNSIIWGHSDDLNVSVAYVNHSLVGDGEYGGLNNNISANPQFVDTVQDDYHLTSNSPAINAGDNEVANLPTNDFEGDLRIVAGTVDIGADEFSTGASLDVSLVTWPDVVFSGDTLQYTIWVTNTGSVSLEATIDLDLPSQVSYGGVTQWQPALETPNGVWKRSINVDVDDSYTGSLEGRVTVSTAQGITETAVATTYVTGTVSTSVLSALPTEINLTTEIGQPLPDQTINILNTGNGSLNWTATTDAYWLSLSAYEGSAPASIQASINTLSLTHGTYTGNITLQSVDAANSPKIIPVTVNMQTPRAIHLEAESGHANIMLSWSIPNIPTIVNYRLLLGNDGVDSTVWTPVATTPDTSYFYEDDSLEAGDVVCFRVEGLRFDDVVMSESNSACAVYGKTTLWIPDVSSISGEIAIVPVNIRNGEGLQMAAADIWVEFDATMLELIEVQTTPLTEGYTWSHAVSDVAEKPNIDRARIGAITNSPPTLHGEGSLFWLAFRVIGDPGDVSILDLREFITGIGGSTIYTPANLSQAIPLTLEDGLLMVDSSFTLGDLNGNGVVESVDAYLALRISVGELVPTANQLQAGDINGNGDIDSGDATMILHYAVHGEWPALQNRLNRTNDANAEVTISLNEVSGLPGRQVKLRLQGEDLANWAGGEFTILYDTAVISTIDSVLPVGLADGFTLEYHDDGQGKLRVGLISNTPRSGSGDIVEINLTISEFGSVSNSQVLLAKAAINDLYGRDFATSALQTSINRNHGLVRLNSAVFLPMIIKP